MTPAECLAIAVPCLLIAGAIVVELVRQGIDRPGRSASDPDKELAPHDWRPEGQP